MFYHQNSPVTVWSVKEERVIYYQKMAQSSKKRKLRSLEEATPLKGTASEASMTSVEAMAATKVEAETGIHDMAQSSRKKRGSPKEAMALEASMTSAESTKAVKAASEAAKAAETGILVHNVDRPRGLAVDWIHLNLYFIDGLRTSIFIVKMKTAETGMYRLSLKICFFDC